MKKQIFIFVSFLLLILVSGYARSQSDLDIEFYAKVKNIDRAVELIRESDNAVIPSLLSNDELEDQLRRLGPDDEFLVKGHIIYRPTTIEGKTNLKPVLMIEDIKPVSLRKLGEVSAEEQTPYNKSLLEENESYSPMIIPITTELASAITLTTATLLMMSLTASESQPHTTQQLNSGLFLFAGLMATGLFFYEQLANPKKLEE